MSMCQSDTRGRVSVSSTSVLRPVVSGARWWVICTTGFPKACYLILHCKTLPHLSPQETLHMNLLRKPCLKLVAHHSRSCCVKGLHGSSMSALEQPCGDDFLTSVGSALLILQNCKLELLTWQQIRVVLWVPVYGINSSYLKILIWVVTWLSRPVFCISLSRQMSCTTAFRTVSAEKGWMSWHWQVIRYRILVWCTQGANVLHRCPLCTSKMSPGRWPGLCCCC